MNVEFRFENVDDLKKLLCVIMTVLPDTNTQAFPLPDLLFGMLGDAFPSGEYVDDETFVWACYRFKNTSDSLGNGLQWNYCKYVD